MLYRIPLGTLLGAYTYIPTTVVLAVVVEGVIVGKFWPKAVMAGVGLVFYQKFLKTLSSVGGGLNQLPYRFLACKILPSAPTTQKLYDF